MRSTFFSTMIFVHLVIAFSSSLVKAQSDTGLNFRTNTIKYDTNYIKSYRNKLCVTLVGNLKDLNMMIRNPSTRSSNIDYKPNSSFSYGLGLDYKWITFEFTTKINFLDRADSYKGSTKQSGIKFGLTGRRVWFSSAIQYFKGLYIDNPEVINSNWFKENQHYPTRKDVQNLSFYASANYSFNHKNYSHMATLWQIDRQMKSAGSFVAGALVAFYGAAGDSSLIPKEIKKAFGSDSLLKGSVSGVVGITGGYVHTFVIKKKLFIHLGLIPGITLQQRTNAYEGKEQKSMGDVGTTAEFRFVAGYNGEKFYGGISSAQNIFSDNLTNGGLLNHTHSYVRLFFGKRFDLKLKLPLGDR